MHIWKLQFDSSDGSFMDITNCGEYSPEDDRGLNRARRTMNFDLIQVAAETEEGARTFGTQVYLDQRPRLGSSGYRSLRIERV